MSLMRLIRSLVMRRVPAIVTVFALLVAPMAVLPGAAKHPGSPFYCSAILQHRGACVVQEGHCMHSSPTVRQDKAQFTPFALLAPLTQMVLPPLIPGLTVGASAANAPASSFAIPRIFLPSPFHPPRG